MKIRHENYDYRHLFGHNFLWNNLTGKVFLGEIISTFRALERYKIYNYILKTKKVMGQKKKLILLLISLNFQLPAISVPNAK